MFRAGKKDLFFTRAYAFCTNLLLLPSEISVTVANEILSDYESLHCPPFESQDCELELCNHPKETENNNDTNS